MFRDLEDDVGKLRREHEQQQEAERTMGVSTVLTARQEREAAYRHVFMGWTMNRIGDHFGVSGSTISRVLNHYRSANAKSGGDLERRILNEFGHL